MDKNSLIEQQMNGFIKLFNEIPKTITFVRDKWLGPHGSLAGLVTDPDFRLIMEPGELAKTTDNYKRKIVLIGTAFGPIAIYPTVIQPSRTGVPTLSYYTTEALSTAIAQAINGQVPNTGKLADVAFFPFLDIELLTNVMGSIVTYCEERHMYVGDGMKKVTPRKPPRQRPPGQKKSAATAEKPAQKKKHPPRQKQATKPKQAQPKAAPDTEVKPASIATMEEIAQQPMAA